MTHWYDLFFYDLFCHQSMSEMQFHAADNSCSYYRQHEKNVVGVNHWAQYSRIKRLINIKKSIVANYNHYRMLRALGYGSLFKYLRYKRLYGKKARI